MPFGSSPLSPAQIANLSTVRYANGSVPAGNTITAQVETAFATRLSTAAGALAVVGTRISLLQWGRYTSAGVTPSITPRIRLGGVALFADRTITGLFASSNNPWQARADFLVTDQGIVGTCLLVIDDNQVRIFGGPPVTGIDLSQALDLTSSAQWGQASCAITLLGWAAEVVRPTA